MRLIGLAIVVALSLLAPLPTGGQQTEKVFRIGAVSAGAPRSSPHWIAFAQRLGELGYVEGRNVSIEFRTAEGRPERFPELMIPVTPPGRQAGRSKAMWLEASPRGTSGG